MEALRKIVRSTTGSITINLPKQYENSDLEIIVLPINTEDLSITTERKKYDFSDLIGKLQWNGDALSEQKKLRDEWQ